MLFQVAMDRERGERQSIESQMRDARREAAELQARYDAHSAELNARYSVLFSFSRQVQYTDLFQCQKNIYKNMDIGNSFF
jgi:flagellar capping protein FliD